MLTRLVHPGSTAGSLQEEREILDRAVAVDEARRLAGDPPVALVAPGECVIILRQVVHGIRNTAASRRSYLAFTIVGPAGYQRGTVGS